MTDASAQWAPDGQSIVFRSTRMGMSNLYRKSSDGGAENVIFDHRHGDHGHFGGAIIASDLTRDARFIVYTRSILASNGFDIWALPLNGTAKEMPQVQSAFNEMHGNVSPDGRWLAYTTNESGTFQVKVQSFPASGKDSLQWLVSTRGGTEPRWRGDGQELYYLDRDRQLVAVPVKPGGMFQAGVPKILFPTRVPKNVSPYRSRYDVAPDGKRFLIIKQTVEPTPVLSVLTNWQTLARK
jgi:hypothetical protein